MQLRKDDPGMREAATQFMLEQVSKRAVEDGLPLTEDEKHLLASQYAPGTVNTFVEKRMIALISEIVEREPPARPGRLDASMRLVDGLRYAGDRDWPYVAQLIEVVCRPPCSPRKRWTAWEWVKDKAVLLIVVLLVLLGLCAVAGVLEALGVLR